MGREKDVKRTRIGVVFGGRSAEHEVSLQSARNVIEALDPEKYEPVLLGIDREGRWHLGDRSRFLLDSAKPMPSIAPGPADEVALVARGSASRIVDLAGQREIGAVDVIFPVLHGPYGEDGSVQGLCKLANIPCVGAGVLGSAVGMDKDVMKRLLRDAGIPTARFQTVRREEPVPSFTEISGRLGAPLFVKPANLGSSVGISKVSTEGEYARAVELAFRYDTKILVEEAIAGRELECSVLGNADPIASAVGEVVPQGHEFYSYEAKYLDENGAVLVIPAQLEAVVAERVRALAVRTFRVLCCDGMGRVDMFLPSDGRVLVNEINTIPGFTKISMYPKLWQAAGISYRELVDRLVQLALDKFRVEQGLETTV